jgi:hypothetical protein
MLTCMCMLLVRIILNANNRKEIGFLHRFYCPILIYKHIEQQQSVSSNQKKKQALLHYKTNFFM